MSDKPGDLPIPGPADFFGWLNRAMNIPAQAAAAAVPPTMPNMTDPMEMWKTMMDRNEQAWATFMRQITTSPEFAQTLGRSSTGMAAYRTMIQKVSKAYLDAAGMPSRDDITQLAKQIVMLDAKVDDVEDAVADGLAATPDMMGRVISTLESLATRLERLEARMLTREEFGSVTERLAALEGQIARLENSLNNQATAVVSAPAEIAVDNTPLTEVEAEIAADAVPATESQAEIAAVKKAKAPARSSKSKKSKSEA